jgi:hypothetical protein
MPEKTIRKIYTNIYTDEMLLNDVAELMDDDGKICLEALGKRVLPVILPHNEQYTEEKAQSYAKARIVRLNNNQDFPVTLPTPTLPNKGGPDYKALADNFLSKLSGAQKAIVRK